ncbi:FG-GAP-like repeat-containing protein [Micromonospora halophytica]|uniref:Repeat domain-containing protein n=1 Tax=Micromonospora halophytica TaxID=47864 RepID=A0A1C5GJK3_9ACTN|nr:FG-GAP-like repeat-containing protein [Micromonospora halophytica]SCG33970.1 Repeat domain-containing protein [Micromonospora halophytica]
MSLRKLLRIGAVVALGLTGLAVTGAPAQAAMPLFQLPFTCGEYWDGSNPISDRHQSSWELDFNYEGGDLGKPVLAAAAGTIEIASYQTSGGFGRLVKIRHGSSNYYTFYAHLNDFAPGLGVGDSVRQGQLIGHVGNTSANGNFGPHLHYEVRYGSTGYPGNIQPAYFNGVRFGYPAQRIRSYNCGGGNGVVRDVNRDGRSDLVAIHDTGALYRYTGNGDGTFDPGVSIGTGWGNFRLTSLADVNGDGVSDILGIHSNGSLYRYLGRGDGTFAAGVVLGGGWGNFRLLTSSDFNNDGRADVLAVHNDGSLYRYAGTADGTVVGWGGAVGGGWSGFRLLTSGDVNGDGKADLLAVGTDGALYRWLGKGDGTFASAVKIWDRGWGSFRLINSADYNNDGRTDLLAVLDDGGLYRYAGQSDGTLASWGGRVGGGWGAFRLINS